MNRLIDIMYSILGVFVAIMILIVAIIAAPINRLYYLIRR